MYSEEDLNINDNLKSLQVVLSFWKLIQHYIIKSVGISELSFFYIYFDKDDFFLNVTTNSDFKLNIEEKVQLELVEFYNTNLNFDISIAIKNKNPYEFNIEDCNYYYAEFDGIDEFDYDIDHGTIFLSAEINSSIEALESLKFSFCFSLIKEVQYAYNRLLKNISLLNEENSKLLQLDSKISQIILIKSLYNIDGLSAMNKYSQELSINEEENAIINSLIQKGKL